MHSPLIIDVVDTATGMAVAGCTYHVAHPGGRNYERFPVNANEAEARRRARFFPFGHTPGSMAEPTVALVDKVAEKKGTTKVTSQRSSSEESRTERDRRLYRECKGMHNAGACLGYTRR